MLMELISILTQPSAFFNVSSFTLDLIWIPILMSQLRIPTSSCNKGKVSWTQLNFETVEVRVGVGVLSKLKCLLQLISYYGEKVTQ